MQNGNHTAPPMNFPDPWGKAMVMASTVHTTGKTKRLQRTWKTNKYCQQIWATTQSTASGHLRREKLSTEISLLVSSFSSDWHTVDSYQESGTRRTQAEESAASLPNPFNMKRYFNRQNNWRSEHNYNRLAKPVRVWTNAQCHAPDRNNLLKNKRREYMYILAVKNLADFGVTVLSSEVYNATMEPDEKASTQTTHNTAQTKISQPHQNWTPKPRTHCFTPPW